MSYQAQQVIEQKLLQLTDGLDGYNFNFADSQQALDDGEGDEFYALVIPKFGLFLTDLSAPCSLTGLMAGTPAVVKSARDTPFSEVGKPIKLEFL